MSSTDDSANDEEQLTTGPTNYRALLAMTRPMAMAEHTPPSLPGQEISGSGSEIPPEPADQRAELALRRGEIIRAPKSKLEVTRDEDPATRKEEAGTTSAPEVEDAAADSMPAEPQTDSNLQIRIYLGMS